MADKTDSGTAYNDLLERAKQTSAKVSELEGRIKALEDRAIREDAKAESDSIAEKWRR
jgi:hypothetical protein